jgi:hypothetical protein
MDYEEDGFVVVQHADVPAADAPPHLEEISKFVDGIADSLWPVNTTIHDNPELGYKEKIAHKVCTEFMERQRGWKVTRSAYGMETAWVAVFDSGKKGPNISFNVEMGTSLSKPRTHTPY